MKKNIYLSSKTLILVLNILLVLISTGCKESAAYQYTIGEEEMVKILVDIHISEAAAEQIDITLRDSVKKVYYEQVFEIQQISKEVFEKEMNYLKKDSEKLSDIYEKVIKKIQEEKKEL